MRNSLGPAVKVTVIAKGLAVFVANSAIAQGLPRGLMEGSNSKPSPVTQNGVTSFTIQRGVCTSRTYGDGRGESNCSNMNVMSYVGTSNRLQAKRGQAWVYAFDFWIDPRTNHKGHHQPEAAKFTGNGVNNSRLEIEDGKAKASLRTTSTTSRSMRLEG